MSPFLRKVPTASGATAVQIVSKLGGKRRILEHIGSAHTEQELAALMGAGRQRMAEITETQQELDLGLEHSADSVSLEADRQVVGSASRMLVEAIWASYQALGFDAQVDDDAFFLMVLARLVEPTSKVDSLRVLTELGVEVVHRNTFMNALKRSQQRDYRGRIAQACFDHSVATTGLSLLLYDVTRACQNICVNTLVRPYLWCTSLSRPGMVLLILGRSGPGVVALGSSRWSQHLPLTGYHQ